MTEFNTWLKKKPKINCECLLITKVKYKLSPTEYQCFHIKKTEFNEKWYWGVFDSYNDEWGDLKDIRANEYYLIKL